MAPQNAPSTVVISDVHMSAGSLDDCDNKLESTFIRFLQKLASTSGNPVELVINGDFLDFVQAPPVHGKDLRSLSTDGIPLCYTQEQSLAKLEGILCAHEQAFRALGGFLEADSDNRLIIIPGNHDADFFWPAVRSCFRDTVASPSASERIGFHLEQVYRPPHAANVWIEHGHQYDRCNGFHVNEKPRWSERWPPISVATGGEKRLLECVGTRFLNKFINRLDEQYPFVDNVKPFSRFLSLFGMSALRSGPATIKAAVAVWSMLRFITSTSVSQPTDLLSVVTPTGATGAHPLATLVDEMLPAAREAFQDILDKNGLPLNQPIRTFVQKGKNADVCMEFLADRFELLDDFPEQSSSLLSVAGTAGTLTLAGGVVDDESAVLLRAAKKALGQDGVDFVIMGHTHEKQNRPNELSYFNTGCWTRYYQFEEGETLPSWSFLKADAAERFPYELNYVEISPGRPTKAKFVNFATERRT